jgi:hypothetical protein
MVLLPWSDWRNCASSLMPRSILEKAPPEGGVVTTPENSANGGFLCGLAKNQRLIAICAGFLDLLQSVSQGYSSCSLGSVAEGSVFKSRHCAGWSASGTGLTLAVLPHCWDERTFAPTSATTQFDPNVWTGRASQGNSGWGGWSCANVSGPCGAKLLAIMDIRAHSIS